MNATLSDKLIEWAESLKDFAAKEIPPFVEEVARYGFYENILLCAFLVVALAVLVTVSICFGRMYSRNGKEGLVMVSVFTALACIPIFCCTADCAKDAVKAKCAPKLYIIERFLKK